MPPAHCVRRRLASVPCAHACTGPSTWNQWRSHPTASSACLVFGSVAERLGAGDAWTWSHLVSRLWKGEGVCAVIMVDLPPLFPRVPLLRVVSKACVSSSKLVRCSIFLFSNAHSVGRVLWSVFGSAGRTARVVVARGCSCARSRTCNCGRSPR